MGIQVAPAMFGQSNIPGSFEKHYEISEDGVSIASLATFTTSVTLDNDNYIFGYLMLGLPASGFTNLPSDRVKRMPAWSCFSTNINDGSALSGQFNIIAPGTGQSLDDWRLRHYTRDNSTELSDPEFERIFNTGNISIRSSIINGNSFDLQWFNRGGLTGTLTYHGRFTVFRHG